MNLSKTHKVKNNQKQQSKKEKISIIPKPVVESSENDSSESSENQVVLTTSQKHKSKTTLTNENAKKTKLKEVIPPVAQEESSSEEESEEEEVPTTFQQVEASSDEEESDEQEVQESEEEDSDEMQVDANVPMKQTEESEEESEEDDDDSDGPNESPVSVMIGNLGSSSTSFELKEFFAANGVTLTKINKQTRTATAIVGQGMLPQALDMIGSVFQDRKVSVIVPESSTKQVVADNSVGGGEPVSIFVKNLSYNTTIETLQSSFHGCLSARIIYDRETGNSKGFGYVDFSSKQEAQKAMDSVFEIDGRSLTTDWAFGKQTNGSSRGRGDSWGESRGGFRGNDRGRGGFRGGDRGRGGFRGGDRGRGFRGGDRGRGRGNFSRDY